MSAIAETTNVTSTPTGSNRVRSTWPIYVFAVVVAGLVGGTIGFSFVGESLVALGIPDPGPATTFGLPLFRAMSWILAALAIGSFMFSAFYISPKMGDNRELGKAPLTVDGHIAARTGAVASLLFALIALFMIPLVLSDVSGAGLAQSLAPEYWQVSLSQLATSRVWLISAIIGLLVGVCGLIFRGWGAQPTLMLGSIAMIVPLGMEGHAAAGGAHDYGTNAYLWHLIFMAIWIGGLMALIAHGRRLGPDMQVAVRRYSAVALFSILAVAASGVVSALLRIEISDLLTTRYGLIITAKIIGTVLLAVVGFAHRAVTIPQLGKRPGAFLRLSIGEVVLMAAIAGIAVTMGRTPPPPPRDPNLSRMAIQLGYELDFKPTFFSVFTVWRFDIMFGAIALLLVLAYLMGVRSIRRQGKKWRASYTWWWIAGCASLLITTSSGIGLYMPATYSMHMVGHMVLSMVVPLIMAQGAPLTLIKTVFDPGIDGRPTPHDWVVGLTNTRFMQILMTPWVNLLQFLFFFYVLYLFIPLYELAISEHAGHLLMNWIFITSGYFYFWELVGVDDVPRPRPASIRLVWLVVSMPIHLFFGVYLMQLRTVMGEQFYLSLNLPWEMDLLRDQMQGGGIAWAFGSFPLTYVFAILFLQWRREEKEQEALVDARLDQHRTVATGAQEATEQQDTGRQSHAIKLHGGNSQQQDYEEDQVEELDELEAYNLMLQRYNQGEGNSQDDYHSRGFRRS